MAHFIPFDFTKVMVSGSFGYTREFGAVYTAGLGCSFNFFSYSNKGEGWDHDRDRYIETGLLVEYNFDEFMEIRSFAHFGGGGSAIVFLLFGYFGFSGVYIIGEEINTFGIAPEIGLEYCFAGIFFKYQLQYDFYLDSKYNYFRMAVSISIPLGWW